VTSDYEFYEELAARLIESGILVEPDSREPFFISAAHDDSCLNETIEKFEAAVGEVLDKRVGKN
jgi:glutamate-1-semialdehyde 2,1-aminomutase